MDALKQYTIPIEGLNNGIHEFDFQIDKAFFQHFEASPIQEGNINLKLYFEKRPDLSVFTFDFEGTILTECDRCLEPIHLPVKGNEQLIVKYADQEDEDAEVIYITSGTMLINVAKFAYEFICLKVPIIKIYDCENDDPKPCNEAMLASIDKVIDEPESTSNPAWEALKKFKKK